jgi:hypothetical protein
MEQFMEMLSNPLVVAGLGYGAAWLVAAFAYALPKPSEDNGVAYVVVYRLIQFAGANLERMKEKQLPPQPRNPL